MCPRNEALGFHFHMTPCAGPDPPVQVVLVGKQTKGRTLHDARTSSTRPVDWRRRQENQSHKTFITV